VDFGIQNIFLLPKAHSNYLPGKFFLQNLLDKNGSVDGGTILLPPKCLMVLNGMHPRRDIVADITLNKKQ
jgi:hypothetical protein